MPNSVEKLKKRVFMINHEQKEYLRFKLMNIRRVFIIRDTEYIESIISGVWAVSVAGPIHPQAMHYLHQGHDFHFPKYQVFCSRIASHHN